MLCSIIKLYSDLFRDFIISYQMIKCNKKIVLLERNFRIAIVYCKPGGHTNFLL